MPSINYALKGCKDIWKHDRFNVLMMIILHANIRNRSWPSIEGMSQNLSISKPQVIRACAWLIEHKAIELVAYDKRVDEEEGLSSNRHIYQLTGYLVIGSSRVPYFYLPGDLAVTDNSNLGRQSTDEFDRSTAELAKWLVENGN